MSGAGRSAPWRVGWWLGAAAVAVGLVAASWALVPRAGREAADRGPIELTMDWSSLQEAARLRWGRDPAPVLRELAAAGLVSVAVAEQTVQGLIDTGEAVVLTDRQASLLGVPVPGPGTWLLRASAPPRSLPAPLSAALPLGAGLPEEALTAAREAGLAVLLRYAARPRIVPWALALADPPAAIAAGPEPTTAGTSRVVIFEGPSVPDPAAVADPMRRAGLALGLVEFAGQRGAPELARRLGLAAVTVHSMRTEEMAASTVADAVARYLRAVRERGARVLYLRPAATAEGTVALVQELAAALRRDGWVVGTAAPQPVLPAPPAWLLALVGVGAGGLAAWAWEGWRGGRTGAAAGWVSALAVLAGLAGGVVVAWARARGWETPVSVLLRQAAALGIALVAPVAAAGAAAALAGKVGSRRPVAVRALGGLAAFVAIGVAGGLMVAALLSDSLFVLRIEQFRGVKLAHALPPLAVGVAALAAAGGGVEQLRAWATRPVRWVDAIVAVLALAAAAYYLVRTGNEAGAVSQVERMVRGWLEQAMAVRPRTKEFVVAYPALAAALYGESRRLWSRWPVARAGLWAVASIGAVSIVNSFAHIHTPLAVTGVRVLNGLALGLVSGGMVWLACELLRRAGVLREGAEGHEDRPVGVLRLRQPGR